MKTGLPKPPELKEANQLRPSEENLGRTIAEAADAKRWFFGTYSSESSVKTTVSRARIALLPIGNQLGGIRE